MKIRRTTHLGLAAIALLLLARLAAAAAMVLIPEEAYYWMYAQHPAWGYLDHPPMIAWLIGAGTALAGTSELGVRLLIWLLGLGSAGLVALLTRQMFGRRATLPATLLATATPLLCGVGLIATPDAPLMFFWLVTLVAVWQGRSHGRLVWWLLAGLACGAAFISKYPGALLVVSTFWLLLSDRLGRRRLRSAGPWLALVTALAVASPVLVWNARHDWASFRFQFARRLMETGSLHPEHTAGWIASQLLVLTPVVFALLAVVIAIGLRRWRRDRRGAWRFTLCYALPWLAICLLHGLRSEVKPHWPLPAYLSLLPAAGLLVAQRLRPDRTGQADGPATALASAPMPRRRRSGSWIGATAAGLVGLDLLVLAYAAWPWPGLPRPRALADWRRIARDVDRLEDDLETHRQEEVFVLAGGNYELASVLAFYMSLDADEQPPDWRNVLPVTVALGGGLNYRYWVEPDRLQGRDAVFVTTRPRPALLLGLYAAFGRVDPPQPTAERIGGRRLWLIPCHGFRGWHEHGLLGAACDRACPPPAKTPPSCG